MPTTSALTVRWWFDVLAATFVVRFVPPWHVNRGRRQVRVPRLYVADSGLVHALHDVADADSLDVIRAGSATFAMSGHTGAVPMTRVLDAVRPRTRGPR
jgi:hypothetical protein